MKLCNDCKHFDGKEYCLHAHNPNYVFGKEKFFHAQTERQWNTLNGCGPDAKFFEPLQLLRDEYPDKYAGLKTDAIRTQGDTK